MAGVRLIAITVIAFTAPAVAGNHGDPGALIRVLETGSWRFESVKPALPPVEVVNDEKLEVQVNKDTEKPDRTESPAPRDRARRRVISDTPSAVASPSTSVAGSEHAGR